jgi:hypothetical protein
VKLLVAKPLFETRKVTYPSFVGLSVKETVPSAPVNLVTRTPAPEARTFAP